MTIRNIALIPAYEPDPILIRLVEELSGCTDWRPSS